MKYVVVSSSQLRGLAMFKLCSEFLGVEGGHFLQGAYDMDYLLDEDLDFLIFDYKYYIDYKNKIKKPRIKKKTLVLINFEKEGKNLGYLPEYISLLGADSKREDLERIFTYKEKPKEEFFLEERDKTILFLLVQGLTNKEIGKKLFLSEKTIKNNLSRIYKGLGVSNRYEAMQAFENKKIRFK